MAFLAPMIATASTATLVSTGISVATAFAQIKQGEATKKAYYAQARYKELEGRIEAVKAKEQGIRALENTRRALASVNASARAGGLEPTIGTPVDIGTFNIIKPGTTDFFTAKDNASLALSSAKAQAEDLRFAGREAKKQGYLSALGTIGTSFANMASIGGPPGTTSTGMTRGPSPGFYQARYGAR
tara:strand:+ start:553 stop:1110 length:558 start_codon:yes stop_codon:yes gene_type:complete